MSGEATFDASAPVHPVAVLLGDPLREVARKERRSLLGISAIAILVGHTGLVPTGIANFGITFTVSQQVTLLWVFTWVVAYYTLAFGIYAFGDFLGHSHDIYRAGGELRRRAAERSKPSDPPRADEEVIDDASWNLIALVPKTSWVRLGFDFIVPVVVALYALYSLVSAAMTTTSTTTGPKTTPAISAPR